MRVLVTGATGFIGTAVVAELREAGHGVTGMTRSSEGARRLADGGASVFEADLTDAQLVAARAAEADGVVHLGFRHDAMSEAVHTDAQVITAIGEALAGSGRPFVVTSGTLVLPADRVGLESDPAAPAAPAGARGANEAVALAMVERGVRVSLVRLAPCVHDRVRRGFVGALIDSAERAGFAGYLAEGTPRWPAVHRLDAAALFRSALEDAPAGSVLHGLAEQGVALRSLAEQIGAGLSVPVRPVDPALAGDYFGWLAALVGIDAAASSEATRQLLGWRPVHATLIDDLRAGDFFDRAS